MPGNTTFGTSCTFDVVYAPVALGSHQGIVDVGDSMGFAKAAVYGTGLAPPPTTTAPPTAAPVKKCKKHRSAAAAKKKCKKKRR
jgi:hypothetical protein